MRVYNLKQTSDFILPPETTAFATQRKRTHSYETQQGNNHHKYVRLLCLLSVMDLNMQNCTVCQSYESSQWMRGLSDFYSSGSHLTWSGDCGRVSRCGSMHSDIHFVNCPQKNWKNFQLLVISSSAKRSAEMWSQAQQKGIKPFSSKRKQALASSPVKARENLAWIRAKAQKCKQEIQDS